MSDTVDNSPDVMVRHLQSIMQFARDHSSSWKELVQFTVDSTNLRLQDIEINIIDPAETKSNGPAGSPVSRRATPQQASPTVGDLAVQVETPEGLNHLLVARPLDDRDFSQSEVSLFHALGDCLNLYSGAATSYERDMARIGDSVLRAKKQLENSFDTIPFLTIVIDVNGRIIRANRAIENWGLKSPNALIGRSVHRLLKRHFMNGESQEHPDLKGTFLDLESFGVAEVSLFHKKFGKLICTLRRCVESPYDSTRDYAGYAVLFIRKAEGSEDVIEHDIQVELNSRLDALRSDRRAVSRELHDGVTQSLTAIKYSLERINEAKSAAGLDQVVDFLRATINDLRNLMVHLDGLDTTSGAELSSRVTSTLRYYESAWPQITWNFETNLDLDYLVEQAFASSLLKIVQEAASNAAQHSDASRVSVHLELENGRLTLRINDDGKGMSSEQKVRKGHHFGITNIANRVAEIGGRLRIRSNIGKGTEILARFPDPGIY